MKTTVTLIALAVGAASITPAIAQPAESCSSGVVRPGEQSCLHIGAPGPQGDAARNGPAENDPRRGYDPRYVQRNDPRQDPRNDQRYDRRYDDRRDPRYMGNYDARDGERWRNGNYYYGARGPEWRRGGHIPREYMGRQYWVQDWRAHHLSAPPRGYQWVQVGGDYVLVALATGIIAQLLLSQQ